MRHLVPLYTYDGDAPMWATRIAMLQAGDAAIVTGPNSGPPPQITPDMAQHLAALQQRGVTVLGYVDAGYGIRSIDSVFDDIDQWYMLGISRIFVDDWPADWGWLRMARIWGAIRCMSGHGTDAHPILVINPGIHIEVNRPGEGMLVVAYEGTEVPSLIGPKSFEVALIHDAPPDLVADMGQQLVERGWAWGWVTSDGPDGNPWDEAAA